MANIKIDSRDIVIEDKRLHISDEKIRSSLEKSYEAARIDARKFKFYKAFGIFFSVAFSLLIALLTAEFKALGGISANCMMWIAIVLCSGCFITGVVLVVLYVFHKDKSLFVERDEAVSKLLQDIKNQENGNQK